MKKILFTLIFTSIYSVSAWAAPEQICSTPPVIFCDNFEDRTVGTSDLSRSTYKNTGWVQSDTKSSVVDASGQFFDGIHGLQWIYSAGNGGSGWMEGHFSGQRTLYYRWYSKWSSNYEWSYVSTKHAEIAFANGHTDHLAIHEYQSKFDTQGTATPAYPRFSFGYITPYGAFYPNVGTRIETGPNQWYCFEVRVTMNTNGSTSDGYIQGWIDGVQQQEYPNVLLETTGDFPNAFWFSAYWNDAGTAHPLMYRWHDNVVISTERIGCLAGGVADHTPPAPPKNLAFLP